jgi:PiT family inorganic phosphate transporter
MGLYTDPQQVHWASLVKILLCWIGTPVMAALIAMILYPALGRLIDRLGMNLVTRSIVLRFALLTAGAYSAYSMGANCSGSITGVFYGTEAASGLAHPKLALALMGGLSITIGVVGFSRKVMYTVGRRLVQLGAFSAFIALLSEAITIHIYAMIGVPVSVTQALVGAVLGIGLVKGLRTINRKVLWRILFGWIATPLIGALVCYLVASIIL